MITRIQHIEADKARKQLWNGGRRAAAVLAVSQKRKKIKRKLNSTWNIYSGWCIVFLSIPHDPVLSNKNDEVTIEKYTLAQF